MSKKDDILDSLSPSARRALKALADKPGDAAHFHQRLTIQHAALMIGAEVIEAAMAEKPQDPFNAQKAGMVAIIRAVTTGYECTMNVLKELYPEELGSKNLSQPPGPSLPPKEENRIRRMDLD